MPTSAVPSRQDSYFTSAMEAEFPAPAVDSTKGLIAEAALNLYAQTADRLQPNRQRLQHNHCELKSVSHSPRPFDSHYVEGDRQMYPAKALGTSREPRRVTKQSALKLVKQALESTVGDKASPVKHIQKAADVDRSTADAWLKGRNLLGAHHLLNLMIEWPEFAAEVRRIYTMERELHEDLAREISALVRRAMQR